MTLKLLWRYTCNRCGYAVNHHSASIMPEGWEGFNAAMGRQHWCEECCNKSPQEWEFFEDAEPPGEGWQGTKLPKEGREVLRRHRRIQNALGS